MFEKVCIWQKGENETNKYFPCSATTSTHCVRQLKQGYTIDVRHVDKSLEKLGVWHYSKLKHETLCNFRLYVCPYTRSECSVAGDIPFLVSHLRDDHKVDKHTGCTFNHRYVKSNPCEVENATWMLTVFHCFGQYFCLHFEAFQLDMAPVYMAFLRLMEENSFEREHYEVFVIATEKSGIATTDSLFNVMWPYFSLVGIGSN